MRASAFTVGSQREQVTRAGSTDGNLLHIFPNRRRKTSMAAAQSKMRRCIRRLTLGMTSA
jgi:hypothetical protein